MRRAVVLAVLVSLAAPSPSPGRVDPLCRRACPGDRAPSWSPDGGSIAFLDLGGPAQAERTPRLAVMAPDGSAVRGLPYNASVYGFPLSLSWSPDSRLIGFQTYLDIKVIRADGGGIVGRTLSEVPDLPVSDAEAAWAPDASALAFVRRGWASPTGNDWCCEVRVARPDGSGRRRLDHPCRIDGTPRRDRLVGSPLPDALYGRAAADRLLGRGGSDFVQGGSGNDRMDGGPGYDRLHGGPGADVFSGGPGDDRIDARDRSRDRVVCGDGIDSVRADAIDAVARDGEHVDRF